MRLILADNNDIVLVGIRNILLAEKEIEIVGEARNKSQLLEMLGGFDADVVMIDYTAEGFDIDTIAAVRQKFPELKVLAITPEQSATTLVHALKAGVMSYIKKDCDTYEIISAVKDTSKGTQFFCGKILDTIRQSEIDLTDQDFSNFTCEPVTLSDRESEVIVLIAEGYTNAQVAEKLFISNHTVNTHRKNIMSKLGVKNTAGIVMYAVKTDLVKPNKFLFSGEN